MKKPIKEIKILIVDDNQTMRKGLQMVSSYYPDIQIIGECTDGDEVLPFLSENRGIDAIIMDIKMERMDGLKATKLVKRNYPKIHVFVHSTYPPKSYGDRFFQSGATNHFLKGTEMSEIIGAIKRCVN